MSGNTGSLERKQWRQGSSTGRSLTSVLQYCGENSKEMSMSDTNSHAHTALLVMDVRVGVVERFANDADLLKRIGASVSAARSVPLPVIYVGVSFRKGYPEISPQNKSFAAIKQNPSLFQDGTSATQIHPTIAPQP